MKKCIILLPHKHLKSPRKMRSRDTPEVRTKHLLPSVLYMRTSVMDAGTPGALGKGEASVNVNQDYNIYPRDKD